ncbi:hypothetical protein [Lysobacter sp. A289]
MVKISPASSRARPNNSFKPNLLRYTNNMAGKACHVVGYATQVGLTQALGRMGTVEDTRSITIWNRIANVRVWLFAHTRPQFHYAVEVLFQSFYYGAVLGLTVLVLNLFNLGVTIDFELVAHLVGPLCVGGIAAGILRESIPAPSPLRGWGVAATYGGVTGLVFAVLIDLRWRGPTLSGVAIGFALGAGFFMLLHWLYEREARKQRAA